MSYSIVSPSDTFQISSEGGISLKRSITSDNTNTYIVTVRASDHGRPNPKFRDELIWVTVSQNTTTLRFERQEYEKDVPELTPVDQSVIRVKVAGQPVLLGELKYELETSTGSEMWKIDRDGVIKVARSLKDRRDIDVYTVSGMSILLFSNNDEAVAQSKNCKMKNITIFRYVEIRMTNSVYVIHR